MLRPALLLALAACGAGRPPPVAEPRPAPRPAPQVAPTHTTARLALRGESTWIEISIVGTDARARSRCEDVIERARRSWDGVFVIDEERRCGTTPLPGRTGAPGFALIDPRELEISLVLPDDAGTVQYVTWYPARDACESARAKIVADLEQGQRDLDRTVQDFVAQERAERAARVQRACNHADALAATGCAGRDATCEVLRDDAARRCATEREILRSLDKHAAVPPPIPKLRCVPMP